MNAMTKGYVETMLYAMTKGYVEAMLFTDAPEGVIRGHYGEGDLLREFSARIPTATIDKAAAACAAFCERVGVDLSDDWRAGCLLWYSRNGHGVGFFDEAEGYPVEWQEVARSMGEVYADFGRWITIN